MTFLIPLSYLNEACFLSTNIDEKKFKMVLKLAQEDLRDVLGAEFYDTIETQYDPINDTFSAENETLYEDYIKDFLAWKTYHNFLAFSQSESTATGIRTLEDDNSTILDEVKLAALEKNVLAYANNYKYKMINFLELEQSKVSTAYALYKGTCKDQFSWGITSVSGTGRLTEVISIDKAITSNQ